MGWRDWLRRLAASDEEPRELAPRHERREAARRRHEAGGPAWSPDDRHVNEDGVREVADIAPGTPGYGGSRLTKRP